MIQVPILFPEDLYKALKIRAQISQRPMADFVRTAVIKELKKISYRSPMLEMAKEATGPENGRKKDFSLKVDEIVYGKD